MVFEFIIKPTTGIIIEKLTAAQLHTTTKQIAIFYCINAI